MPASRTPARPAASRSRSASSARKPGVRPTVTPQQLHALREAVALRQALVDNPATVPGAGGTAAVRVAASRPTVRRPVRKPSRAAIARARAARRAQRAAVAKRWSGRVGVVGLSTLLLPAAVALVLPGSGGKDSSGDITTLALTAQSTLLHGADQYRQLEQVVVARKADLRSARAAEQAARATVAVARSVVGTRSADLYRAGADARYPVLTLNVHAPVTAVDALARQAVTDRADADRERAVVRAQRSTAVLAAATSRVARASAAVRVAAERADAVLAESRDTVAQLSPAVAVRLASLTTVPATGAEKQRNGAAILRWQQYLDRLAAADIAPPTAADLTSGDLPAGLSPALDATHKPIPGIAWAVIGNHPVAVLPAETIAAVSNALSQLGKPYAGGASGPDTYDCGGFTAANWLLAGFAVPSTPQEQWSAGAAVPTASLQVGDLVFSAGGRDVGIYLGNGDVLGASAATFRVGIRSLAAGSAAVRVTLPAPAKTNAALPSLSRTGTCGAILPKPGSVSPAWGGWANGQIPGSALCGLGVARHVLRCDAATSYSQMSTAYAETFGRPLCITDSYRPLSAQITAFDEKPALAALPGTSNHGWALAVDLCGGINIAGTPQWIWMTINAARFGFVQPDWAGPKGEKPEPWHWEYGYIS